MALNLVGVQQKGAAPLQAEPVEMPDVIIRSSHATSTHQEAAARLRGGISCRRTRCMAGGPSGVGCSALCARLWARGERLSGRTRASAALLGKGEVSTRLHMSYWSFCAQYFTGDPAATLSGSTHLPSLRQPARRGCKCKRSSVSSNECRSASGRSPASLQARGRKPGSLPAGFSAAGKHSVVQPGKPG